MTIALLDVTTTPADNAAQQGPTITVAPPAGMQDGDLVYVSVRYRASSGTITVGNAGGQDWQSTTQYNATNIRARIFWCRFSGSWSADPTFTVGSGTNNMDGQMLVFRPTSAAHTWSLEVGPTTATYTAPSTPFTVTRAAHDTTANSTVSIAAWHSVDDNSWGTLTGADWSKTGLAAQYRNNSTADNSSSFAYNIQTAPATLASVSQNQTALGGDAGSTSIVTFAEVLITAPLTGLSSTASAGSLGVSNAFTGIAGVEATGEIGNIAAIVPGGGTNATANPLGAVATAEAGTLGLVLSPVAEPVGAGIGAAVGALAISTLLVIGGVSSTATAGDLAATGASAGVVPIGGVVSTATAGSLASSVPVVGILGVSATAAAGTPNATSGGIVHGAGQPSAVFATAQAGSIAVSITLPVNGVAVTVNVADLLSASILEEVDGNQGTWSAGNVTPQIASPLGGASTASAAGTPSTSATAVVSPSGVQSVATVGNLAGITDSSGVGVAGGVEADAQVGQLSVAWTFTVNLQGVQTTAEAGTTVVEGGDSTPVEVFPSGVSAVAQVGALSTGQAQVSLQGLQLQVSAGNITVSAQGAPSGQLVADVRIVSVLDATIQIEDALDGTVRIVP